MMAVPGMAVVTYDGLLPPGWITVADGLAAVTVVSDVSAYFCRFCYTCSRLGRGYSLTST